MSAQPPIVVRLPPAFVRDSRPWVRVLDHALPGDVRARVAWRFVLCPDEQRFARALMVRHSRLWLYRTDQQARSGDFVVVDMSSPRPGHRRVWVVDVKLGAALVRGGGGAGNSLSGFAAALAALAAAGVVCAGVVPALLVGDRRRLVEAIGR